MKAKVLGLLAAVVFFASLVLAAAIEPRPAPIGCPPGEVNCDPPEPSDTTSGLRVAVMIGGALVGGGLYVAAMKEQQKARRSRGRLPEVEQVEESRVGHPGPTAT
jgi:hypothetical protein